MRPLRSYQVLATLPERLRPLEEIAYNLRWAWNYDARSLFRRLDGELWEATEHNPASMLGLVSQRRLQEVEEDEGFLAHLDRVVGELREYMEERTTWYARSGEQNGHPLAAYFSMEFGLTDCMPIYSGGLGILAGDLVKSASELGVPLVGVGLLYQKGYFQQYLSPEGWQQERYPINDFYNMPVSLIRGADEKPVRVTVELDRRPVVVQLWKAQVGRVSIVLLDTNVAENPRELQDVTDELYGGDLELRIRQEMVLGVGGMRALDALGLRARVYHMNEGHSAFVGLERVIRLMKERNLSYDAAKELVTATTVFTTHTPVPAGIDVFPADLVERYLGSLRQAAGLSPTALLDLGRVHAGDKDEPFNMAVLSLHLAASANGVSRLHASVSRAMWRDVWPGVPVDEAPIGHITNGVHAGSWISDEMQILFDRYLGPRWAEEPGDTAAWRHIENIPAEELWRAHERRRERLVAFVRRSLVAQLRRRGAGPEELARAGEVLDPDALTIGFGRRFAAYKRATLVLRDPERLARILNDPQRPVQIIFSGKAHPRDDTGKALIRDIVRLAGRAELRRRLVFLEDYDMATARYLVQGCDVWLNTPRRPREASGTSGMKAAFNGALNLSVPDGWWAEAYNPSVGWAIGTGEQYDDPEVQDRVEAGTLYGLIEREAVPLFYDRGPDGLPRRWVGLMKTAMRELCPVFNTNRMLREYVTKSYLPAARRRARLEEESCGRATALAAWRRRVRQAWPQVRVERVESDLDERALVGGHFRVSAVVEPAGLEPGDLAVQVYYGKLDDDQQIVGGETVELEHRDGADAGRLLFEGAVPCEASGLHGFTVRVLARHEDLAHPHATGLIVWASN